MNKINRSFENQHRKQLKEYDKIIESIYKEAIQKVTSAASNLTLNDGVFNIRHYPFLNQRVNQVIAELKGKMEVTIVNGAGKAWQLANMKNDKLVDGIISKALKESPQSKDLFNVNLPALKSFLSRKENGMNLSDRVWKLSSQYRKEMEAGLAVSIKDGKSAIDMAKDLQKYLKDPDKLFRRVRGEDGLLKESKAAAAFKPGRGVYKSSYKNALRLARTETNLAYRNSDHERWQQLPFVVGQQISLSNRHPQFDICDKLAGRYPTNFIFNGWHPQCLCFKTPIMLSDEEYNKYEDSLLKGKNPRIRSENKVTDVPESFHQFVNENKSRIDNWKNTPYWVKDNFKHGDINKGLNFKTKPEKLPTLKTFLLNEESIQTLKAKGLIFSTGEQYTSTIFNSFLNGFDVSELLDDFDKAARDFKITPGQKTISASASEGSKQISIRLQGMHNGKELFVERHMNEVNGIKNVYHAYFKIPEALQGNGYSKRILGMFYNQYKNSGIKLINVTANINVGGYTWAKYGFNAKSPMDLYYGIRYYNQKNLSAREFNTISDMIKRHMETTPHLPFPVHKIANLSYGKKALLNTNWSGVLDLSDQLQKRRFEDYLYGKKRRKQ